MSRKGLNIYKRKDGRWEGRIHRGRKGGKTQYYSVYGHTYREVRDRLLEMRADSRKETQKCALSVSEVMEQWLKDKQPIWKESTYACYRGIVNAHISKSVGQIPAVEFSDIRFHGFLRNIHCRDGLPAAPAYLHNIGASVIQAFRHMSREYHYSLPVLTNMKTIRTGSNLVLPSEAEMEQLRDFLYLHEQDSTCVGILLAYHTGIRLGELCALKWEDIDLDKGVLTVNRNMQRVKDYRHPETKTNICIQTPKTMTSVRSIPLPDGFVKFLRQNSREKKSYVIQGKNREWAEARTVQYRFSAILRECGITHFKFHTLRHHFATVCIQQGFDVKSLSEILGHSAVQTTMSLYVHSSMAQKRRLMNRIFESGAD